MSIGPIHFTLTGEDLEVEAKSHRGTHWFDFRVKGALRATMFVDWAAVKKVEAAFISQRQTMDAEREARWHAEQEAISHEEQLAMREEER